MENVTIWLNGFSLSVKDAEDYETVKKQVKQKLLEMIQHNTFDFEVETDD